MCIRPLYDKHGSDGPGILSMEKTRVKPGSYSQLSEYYPVTTQDVAPTVALPPICGIPRRTPRHPVRRTPHNCGHTQISKDGEGVGL